MLHSLRSVHFWCLALLLGFTGLQSGAARAAGAWPDLSVPPSVGGGEEDAAVVVGIENYAFVDGIPGAKSNALDWYNYLVKGRKIPATSTFLLLDDQALNVQILQSVQEAAARVKPGGTLWFIFIGHGAPGKEGRDGLLVGVDASRSALGIQSRSINHSDLLAQLQTGPQANTVLVLDACYSGKNTTGDALVEGLQFLVPSYSLPTGKATILTAAKADQFAGRLPGLARPAFSYLVLGAMRGWGDQDRNGSVTAAEAVAYAKDMLLQLAKDRRQEPELLGETGGLVLGRGRELGPPLEEMVVGPAHQENQPPKAEIGVAKVQTGIGDYTATLAEATRLKNLREETEKREAEVLASLKIEQDRRVAEARAGLLNEASGLWTASQPLVKSGGPEAMQVLQAFIDKYGASKVSIDNKVETVHVPQVVEARMLLDSLKKAASAATKPTPSTNAPPSSPSSTNKPAAVIASAPTAAVPTSGAPARRVLTVRDVLAMPNAAKAASQQTKRHDSMKFLKDLLVKGTAQGEQKAEMMLRLGVLYFEEGRYLAPSDPSAAKDWEDKSIKIHQQVLQNYPQFGRADEASYYLATAFLDTGLNDDSVKEYTRLVRTYPQSAWVPDAYVAIGEYYFENNNSYKALVAYQKASAYKNHDKYPFSLYKLAWCYYNVGEYGKAIDTMKVVVATALAPSSGESSTLNGSQLGDEALQDLVRFFADAGEMDEAYAYFNKLGKKDLIRTMLRRLGAVYVEQGKYEQGIQTLRRLVAENPQSQDAPVIQGEIIQATMKIGKKEDTLSEIDRLLKTYGKNSAWARANSSKNNALSQADGLIESNLRTVAVNYHNEAKKLGASEAAKQTYALSYKAYTVYLNEYPDSKYTLDMRYSFAELLYKIKKYDEAYDQYRMVVAKDPQGSHAEFCAESAIFAADEMVKRTASTVAAPATKDPVALTPWEEKLLLALDQYAEAFPNSAKTRNIVYRSAYLLFNKNHFREASDRFRVAIILDPKAKESEQAAKLILDAFALVKDRRALCEVSTAFLSIPGFGTVQFQGQLRATNKKECAP